MAQENPFYYNLPVQPADFVGRWPLVDEIAADLCRGRPDSWAVIGGRRFGKSSVLKAVEARLLERLAGCGQGERHVFPLLVDLKGSETDTEQNVYARIVRLLHRALARGQVLSLDLSQTALDAAHRSETLSFYDFEEVLDDLAGCFRRQCGPLRLVLLLDEVEATARFPWCETLFNQLRSLVYDGPLADTVRLVLTGSARVVHVRHEGSPLLNAVKIVHLASFPEAAMDELLARGGAISADAAQEVKAQSGGHPFIAQYLLHHLWDGGLAQATVNQVRRVAQRMRQERAADLRGWWEAVGEAGRQAYRLLAGSEGWMDESTLLAQIAGAAGPLDQGLAALCYHGLAVRDESGRRYRVAGALFRDWFASNVQADAPRPPASPPAPTFSELHRTLTSRYSLEELRTLCAEIGVPFDDLGGEGRSGKARELILWLQRRGRLDTLSAYLSRPTLQHAEASPPGGRGVQIGGNAQGSIIITGDWNVVTTGPLAPPAGGPAPCDALSALKPAIARIYGVRGGVIGAGFLVGRREVLTCAHVVTGALGLPDDTPEPPQAALYLDFPLLASGTRLTAQAVRWQPQDDIAVLELTCDPPTGAVSAPLAEGGDLWGHPFRAFGFPAGHSEGVWASGVIRGPDARGWLQIEDTKETGYRVQPGFSGSPVWDETLRGVVGMVTAGERDPAVKAAFIIPTSLLPPATHHAPRTTHHIPRNTQHVPNPFCDRGRINDPARFFDRVRILRDLCQMLAAGNSVSLVGEPQIGKSSVLYHLYLTRAEWLQEATVHYLDLQAVLDTDDFCAEVLEAMGQAPGDLRALKRALRRQRLVLLLDEVEKLARPAFGPDLHDLLRALAQEPTLTLAVASHRPLVEVFPPSSDTSPFHNIFTEKRLGPFTSAEAREFLDRRLQGTGVTFTQEEVERLVMESGGHPARLQRLAYALFEKKLE